ncbi:MAG: SusC/RagA family TonB-linked outer membrane protein [Cyclobacteriaceae bacterium]
MNLSVLRQLYMLSKYCVYGLLIQCIIGTSLLASKDANAQRQSIEEININIEQHNKKLIDIFNQITATTDFEFAMNRKKVNLDKSVDLDQYEGSLGTILREISTKAEIGFKRVNNNIFVKNIDKKGGKIPSNLVVEVMEVDVSGKVTDENGQGLPGASVVVKGTTNGTTTNLEGDYSMTIPDDATLVISFVGYTTQEVVPGARSTVDIQMEPDAEQLEEVVVIGYGTSKKKDLTGSIVSVKGKEVAKYKPSSVSEILRTTVPGMVVGYATNARNVPDFEIRGDISIKADDDDERNANKPLIVLDGVIFLGDLAEINPNDIESVDVLKDASAAAIYGSQASNGVVIFTTKKGQLGKAKINFSSKVSLVTGAKRIQTHKGGEPVLNWLTDMNESINGLLEEPWTRYRDYYSIPAEFQDDWLAANGIPGETNRDAINLARINNFDFWEGEIENFQNGQIYDWQDFLFHTGVRKDVDVSVSGRNEKVSYYFSMGASERESVQIGETFETITSRLNLTATIAEFLDVGVNSSFTYQNEGQEPIGNGGYRTKSPYDQPWENGAERTRENLVDQSAGSNQSNPYQVPAWNTRKYDRFMINPTLFTKFTLPYGFSLRVDYTPRFDARKRFDLDENGNPQRALDEARRRHNEVFSWQWNNILSWDKSFGDHRFSVTALYNAEKNERWETDAINSNFSPTSALGFSGMAFGLNPKITSYDEKNSRTAIMGRVNYSFGNRYNFSASIRRDGYSRFGSDNIYASFPSLSAAWTITNEDFMASAPGWISRLKLRASWGVNGNSSGLEDYNAFARLSNNLFLNYDGGYIPAPYTEISRIANPLLAWEKTTAINLALDFGLFNDRLSGSIDVYNSTTNDLLLDQKLPDLTGLPSAKTNVGSLKNSGFDIGLNGTIMERQDFLWSATLNATYRANHISTLGNDPLPVTDNEGNAVLDGNGNPVLAEPNDLQNGWFIGENKDVIWDFEADGVYQVGEEAEAAVYGLFPGDFRVVDQDQDGDIDVDDKVFLGLTQNPWYLTMRQDLEWKGFDFGVVFLAKLGYKGRTIQPFNWEQGYIKNHNWFDLPYWTPQNRSNEAARINSIRLGGHEMALSKSYVRLQNVSFGYSLPPSILEKINFDRVRFAFNIENAAVFTGWHIGDPESEREMPRTYSFSLDFTF